MVVQSTWMTCHIVHVATWRPCGDSRHINGCIIIVTTCLYVESIFCHWLLEWIGNDIAFFAESDIKP